MLYTFAYVKCAKSIKKNIQIITLHNDKTLCLDMQILKDKVKSPALNCLWQQQVGGFVNVYGCHNCTIHMNKESLYFR